MGETLLNTVLRRDTMSAVQLKIPGSGDTVAVIHTSMGDIKILLFPERAPKTVENFVTHSKNGYYDGLKFHRVINDFMIQGGDPRGNGTGGESIWGGSFADEFDEQLHNLRGALSMANSGPNTNGSQFFITTVPTPWLNMHHTIFGEVVEGFDTVKKIENCKTGFMDKPAEEQKILSVEVSEE